MFKVVFTMRESSSYPYSEEKQEYYFRSEIDANNFYNDLENFIDKTFKGTYHVISKSTPEKLNPILLLGYNLETKRLYLVD